MALRLSILLEHCGSGVAARGPLRLLMAEQRALPHLPSARPKATVASTSGTTANGTEAGARKEPKKGKKVAAKRQTAVDAASRAFPPEVENMHREIMKVLQNRRHQLKAKIRMLREEELVAAQKGRGRARTASLPARSTHRDRRLDILSTHIHDGSHFEQDHLRNVSDFRIQAQSALTPSAEAAGVVPHPKPQKETKKAVGKRMKEEADEVAQGLADASIRELTLKHLNASLKSYILACTHIDLVKPLLATFTFYREQYPSISDRRQIVDVSAYNLLLNVFAKKGKMSMVKEIFQYMKTDGIHPNARSFALALETVARQESIDAKMAKKIVRQMQEEDISVNDIFLKCSFVMDEKERILSVIHTLRPNFQPCMPSVESNYQPLILETLNTRPSTVLKDTPYRGVLPDHAQSVSVLKEQIEREMRGVITVKSVDAVPHPDAKVVRYRSKLEGLKEMWAKTLETAFIRNIEALQLQFRHKKGINIYPYLSTLKTSDYVTILVEELVRLAQGSEGYSASTFVLHLRLGQKVMNKYLLDCKTKYQLVDRLEKTYAEYLKYFEDKQVTSLYNCRQYWEKVEHDLKLPLRPDLGEHLWSKSVLIRIGKFLYDMIINEIKLDGTILRLVESHQYVPAVYTVYRHNNNKLKEEVKPHPVLAKLYKGSMPETLNFDTDMCPTIVPPHPWLSTKTGGYLLQKTLFTRVPDTGNGQGCVVDIAPTKQIAPILDTLNQLGASPWIVNKPMLDLIIQVFRNKGMPDVDIPPPVSECPPLPKITRELTPEERITVYRERFMLKKKRSEMFSLWCDALYKLSIANHFRDSVFWFPQNIDFRGRVYPVPPHFQHLGGDMARSMLLFAKGMPLGEKGLDWLKIHLINLTGLKKKSALVDRLAYANEIMADILDSADEPLTGRQWWKQSDDPWQTLACCKEIAKASQSLNPAAFISHFPIHQDGSCNGLQHYAALGRDQKGAEAVNLYPFETPQDVYSGVAALVEKERKKDADSGMEIAQTLDGFVGRKVVKQTVMTIVYGVTRYGAKAQIQGQLADIKDFPANKSWPGAAYLAGKTFDSIKQMFTSARQIQDWFVDSARLISTVCDKPVEWITPLGLPVLQPYFKVPSNHSRQSLDRITVENSKPNAMKQKNAFPPNFVHSLDSSHMMLTCLHAARAGISFASVHDSYWTHPANVDLMNRLCREQFVALHSLPILDDLSEFLQKRFAFDKASLGMTIPNDPREQLNEVLKNVPVKGDFDLTSVLRSTYFFS